MLLVVTFFRSLLGAVDPLRGPSFSTLPSEKCASESIELFSTADILEPELENAPTALGKVFMKEESVDFLVRVRIDERELSSRFSHFGLLRESSTALHRSSLFLLPDGFITLVLVSCSRFLFDVVVSVEHVLFRFIVLVEQEEFNSFLGRLLGGTTWSLLVSEERTRRRSMPEVGGDETRRLEEEATETLALSLGPASERYTCQELSY